MFKHLQKLLLIAALLCVPWVTNAQTTVTVADGTETNSYIPVYGLYADEDQHNQFIYPASMLSDLSGMITGMTFYMSSPASSAWGGSATISIMEVSGTTVTSILPTTGATTVWTGTVNGNTNTWALTFDTPYTYGGGNLLIDIDYVTVGDYASCSWTGVSQPNGSYCTYGSSTYPQNFLPKVTFEYAPAGDFCFAPRNLTGTRDESDIDFTWIDTNNTNSSWIVAWGPRDFNPDTAVVNTDVTTTQAYSLTNLDDGQYTFAVRANCGTDSSSWVYFDFNIGVDIINMSATGVDTLYTCNAIVYDNGGPTGSYATNCQSTLVIRPGQEDVMLRITGQSYTEGTWDYLRIYEGIGTSGELLFDDYGVSATQTFGPFEADAVTVVFHSDGSVNYDGFQINAVCVALPDCSRPYDFTVTNVTHDSVYFSWVDSVNSNWTIGYGPAGFDFDTCNTFVDFTETYGGIGELTPNTPYDFYLMAVCSGDSSWFRMITVRTTCVPIDSLPWSQNFESEPTGSESTGSAFPFCMTRLNNGTSYGGYPYVSSSSSYNHTPGGSKGLYWYNTTTTGTYGDYQIVVMPGLDPEYISLDTLQFKFWAKSSSTSYYPDFQVGVMTNPNDPASFTQVASVNVGNNTQWAEFTVPLGTYEGTGRYIALRALRPSSSWYAYVDDLTIEPVPNCPPVVDLAVNGVTTQYASLQWDYMRGILEDAPDGYTVELVEVGSTNSPTTQTTTDPYIVFSGLTPGTQYKAYVSVSCSDGDGAADSIEFTTVEFGCIGLSENMIGDPNSTSNNYTVPVNNYYRNTMSQQLIMANELGSTPGYIRSVSFDYYYSSPSTVKNDCEIWIGLTSLSSLSTSQLLDTSQMTKVYAGPLNCSQGWNAFNTMQLDSVYYPGDTNVVVCVIDNSNDYDGSSYTFRTTSATGKTVAYYSDSYNYYANASSMTHTTYSYRSNMILTIGECQDVSTCAAPAAWVTNVSRDSVSIEWIPGASETSWNLYVDSMGTKVYIATTTDTYYDFSGLTASTDYKFYVENVCDDSLMCSVTATTLPDDAWDVLPFVCTFDSTNMDGVWQRVNNNQTNKWYIGMAGDSRALMISEDGVNNTYNISSTSASHAYARINLPAGEYAYSFDWRAVGESSLDYILAYIVPDSYTPVAGSYTIPSNAIRIDGGSYLNQSGTWQTRSDVINITDSGVYKVVFTWRNDGSVGTMPPAGIDNVMIARNTCPRPTSITLDSVTTTTATFHWVDNSTTTTGGYMVEYNGIVDYTTNTSYTATNLSPSTGYTFRVYSICDLDDTSFAITLSTYTACGSINTFPYVEQFNSWGTGSNVHAPLCWTYGSDYSSSYPYISNSYNHSGTGGAMYMYDGSTAGSTNKTWFALPELDGSVVSASQIELLFYTYRSTTSYEHPVMVGVGNNSTLDTTVVWIDTVYPVYNVWTGHEVFLDSYTGTGLYIFFATNVGGSYAYSYPYIDDITVDVAPSCARPDNLTATNATSNSVDLAWHDRANASLWEIEYGPAGFTLGTGTTVIANSNPFTLTGLPSSYQGEYYVRAICSATDSGAFNRNACGFNTTQVAATLPYDYDFENAAEWANWQHSTNNASYDWYRGTAANTNGNNSQYSMYVSADQGVTYRPYTNNAIVNAAVYRDVDFGPTQSSFTVTFDARAGGTIEARYDALMVFLVDPAIPTVASESGITSPWGNVNDLYRIALVYLDTNWTTYTASFDTISGVKRVAFFWFNQNTPSYASYPEAAAVDNIHIEESACPRPVATTLDAVTSTSANLSWTGPTPANYEVIYRKTSQTPANNVFLQSQTNSISLTGLDPLTEYAVWVRKLCGNDTSLTSDGLLFTTDMCDGATYFAVGDSNASISTSYNVPLNNFYRYTLCEFIIDSAELGDATEFNAIQFYYNYATASTAKTDVDIYIMTTTDSVFASTSDMRALDSTAVHVYSGNLNCSQGWNLFGFDTTYTWDGHSNLIVVIDDNSYDYDGSSYVFRVRNCNGNKTIDWYSDSYDPDVTNTSSYSGSKYLRTFRPEMQLISCGGTVCRTPAALSANNVTYNSATVNWAGTATDYEVAYKAANEAIWPEATPVTGNTFAISNLAPATTYQFRVRAICDATEELISDWTVGTFVTDSLPCFAPSALELEDAGMNTATFSWTANGEENAWNIHVWNTAFDQNYDVTANPATVTGLTKNTTYYAAVQAICGNGAAESEFSDTISFTTADCPIPTGVAVNNVTTNAATVTWSGTAASYVLEYGPVGFPEGEGTMVNNITGTSYTLTGLNSSYSYDVYVMANCDGQNSSNWSEPVTFTTQVGIDGVDGVNVTLYPNPASQSTTVTLSGVSGEVTITIVDMNGRTVRTEQMSCEGDCVKTMEVSGLAQGAYFVRVNGDNVNMVKKLVVK